MIIILNGPPHCGKDTLANILQSEYDFIHHSMKSSLIKAAAGVAGISEGKLHCLLNNRDTKEVPQADLAGLSPRKLLIHTSEVVVKPLFGKQVFGEREAKKCKQAISEGHCSIVYSDGGFKEELEAMAQELGEENILLVRLRRDGFTFEGDSRSYLEPIGDMSYLDIKLENGKPERAVQDIMSVRIQMLYGDM